MRNASKPKGSDKTKREISSLANNLDNVVSTDWSAAICLRHVWEHEGDASEEITKSRREIVGDDS